MSDYCGQCRQFTRTEGGGFFMPRKPKRGTQQQAGQSTGGAQ